MEIMNSLPPYLAENYEKLKIKINERLLDFSKVPENEYFYELCYCLCTPQSSAVSAAKAVERLKVLDFLTKQFNPVEILMNPRHYIRFHNTKSNRLLLIFSYFDDLLRVLSSGLSASDKRLWLLENVNGFGLKECSHFLRNIGYRNLAILDRHVLKHLVFCDVLKEVPKISGTKKYFEIEMMFKQFSNRVNISVDELDLLFWSYETGKILK